MTDILGPADAPNFTTSRPADDRTIGATDTWMKDCTGPNVNDGTKLRAGLFNSILANLRTLVRGNGNTGGGPAVVTEDNADDMLLRGVSHLIQRGQAVYGVDSGTANALVVSLSPALAEYKAGLTLRIKAANSNTGATTLNVNGLGAKTVTRRDGSLLRDSDVISGAVQEYVYDGTSFQLTSAFGRVALVRNVDLYVNGAVGNDANDGTANTSGKALATLQKAVDIAFGYPPSQFTITIHVADGTYTSWQTPSYGGPSLVIDGNSTTLANVVISVTSGISHCCLVQGPNTVTVKNLKIQNSGSAGAGGFVATMGAILTTINTFNGAITSGGAVWEAFGGAQILVAGNHVHAGSYTYAAWAMFGGQVQFGASVAISTSTPVTCTSYAYAASQGGIFLNTPNASWSGSATTGARYTANLNAVISVNGGGASVFPGTVAGSTATGGQYA